LCKEDPAELEWFLELLVRPQSSGVCPTVSKIGSTWCSELSLSAADPAALAVPL